jgi:DNA-directed RNA polymerase subunit E'/Rpb7
MSVQQTVVKPFKKKRGLGIYVQNVLTRKVSLSFNIIGNNLSENILLDLTRSLEGKCVEEGFVKPNSIRIVNYSSGIISDKYVIFTVMFECLVCRPVEGMRFRTIIKNVTKAGIRCETKENPSPVVVFIARDHHFKTKEFSELVVGDEITVKVIGIRFELNDNYISIIAELVTPKKIRIGKKGRKKPIVILNTKNTKK